tara:strand:- start:857 stop:1027 length:171 start_codon:yes stop_codon:yes gene_type:complete
MNACTGNCDQGRRCTCLPDRNLFWDVMEGFVTLAVIFGVVAGLCMLFGYIWYRVTP